MPASLFYYGPLVKRLRQRPLTPLTWVRFPHGSPKNAPQLRLGSFFGASVRGIEQDGRPQAAKNNPADCFLVRGRWTHGSPRSTTSFEVVLFSLYALFNRCRVKKVTRAGIEKPGPRVQRTAGQKQPRGLFLGPGRFTFYAPHWSSNRIRCSDGFCFCFYGGYGVIEAIAGFANETVIDFDAHDRFTINYLFLVDDDFFQSACGPVPHPTS